MHALNSFFRNDRGASAILVAISMTLLMGFAALVIDVGAGFNERRQDQTAADISAMAGALELAGSADEVIAEVMDYANRNVRGTITAADWAGCTNPDMDSFVHEGTALDFTALTDAGGTTYPCISTANNGFLQVKIPVQTVDTTFGKLLGVDSLTTDAFAIAQVRPSGGGGILPFGLTSGAGAGLNCLRTGPIGNVVPPCDTAHPQTGNFFIIDSPLLGNPDMGSSGTSRICTGQNQLRYSTNLAVGMDHFVEIHGTNPLREDDCDQVLPANQLMVQTGSGLALEPGLISNNTYAGFPSRLQQGTNNKRGIRDGNNTANTLFLDNRPLWSYLTGGGSECAASEFNPSNTELEKQANMDLCLKVGNPTFDPLIRNSPRLVQVPKFEEATWPPGASELRTILSFEGVFLHALYFGCNGAICDIEFYPGEVASATSPTDDLCAPAGPGCKNLPGVTQLTSFVIPASSLPDGTFPNNGPSGSLNVAESRLWR